MLAQIGSVTLVDLDGNVSQILEAAGACRHKRLSQNQGWHLSAESDNCLLSWAMQDLDTDGADRALEPAFAAINASLHKQQPSAGGGSCSSTQLPFFLRYSSAWVYAAMATTGVSLMEKRKQWQQAVDLLQQLLGEHTVPVTMLLL